VQSFPVGCSACDKAGEVGDVRECQPVREGVNYKMFGPKKP
jgi:hypothetical protein